MIGVYVLPINYDVDEAIDWYKTIEKNYWDQKWPVEDPNYKHPLSNDEGPQNDFKDSYAWSLDTLKQRQDPSFHMYNHPLEQNYIDYQRTFLCCGWGERVVNFFPKTYRIYLTVSKPGTILPLHVDAGTKYRIHLPIITNDQCVWMLQDGDFSMPAGRAYMADTEIPHGTHNRSFEDRVHLSLELQKKDSDYIWNIKGTI